MSARQMPTASLRELSSRLAERDLAVLRSVSELRFLTGSQLTRQCFMTSPDPTQNARAARRALLRLTRLGVLVRLPRPVGGVRAGSAGFVYRLGVQGHRLAVLHGWQPEQRRRRSLAPGSLFLRHTLLIAELHTRLIESERAQRFELLALSAEPFCWREMDGLGTQRLKPDSYVRLGIGSYEDSFFIEIDRGTEGSRTIARQLGLYAAYYRSGVEQRQRGVFPCVLWLATTAERVGVIAACVQRLPGAEQALFRVERFEDALAVMTGADSDSDDHNSLGSSITPMI
ncbi:MAG: replication-relaxation family protein [Solirubrobacterales bacterium]